MEKENALTPEEQEMIMQLHKLRNLGTDGRESYEYILGYINGALLPRFMQRAAEKAQEERKVIQFPGGRTE